MAAPMRAMPSRTANRSGLVRRAPDRRRDDALAAAATPLRRGGAPLRRRPATSTATATVTELRPRDRAARREPAGRAEPAPRERRPALRPTIHRPAFTRRTVQSRRHDGGLVRRAEALGIDPTALAADPTGARRRERAMVKATAGVHVEPAPPVPAPRRRRATRWAVVLCALVVVAMAGAAAFQTQLAQRQVQLDKMQRAIDAAHTQYEQLRRERAQLRSPARLSEVAQTLGMVTAAKTTFMVLTPDVMATVQASTSGLDPAIQQDPDQPLQAFSEVKSAVGVAP